ncbi:MAG: cysteine--tRNA ligase [Clostridiales bacterium]|nr:cysteine--tRNA ligase [Clostridiales bacterium]
MRVYNTLSKRKEEFVTLEPGKVKMYVCGPTVYNLIHIGNARPMIVFDTVRRYLEHKGYEVNYVSNFTDVDDKIIAKANEEGVSSQEISERYIAECQKDMEALNVRPATTHPRATQEIDGMIAMIQTLVDKGYAYDVDGTVYFRTRKFQEYGKLSHKNLDDLRSGNRSLLVTGEDQKEDPLDFVLWKPKKEGEPSWPSPWSDGRPGWHIECSVMSKKYLGEQIDIHAGGEDLIFPHHENEIAQSECCNGKEFAKYWLHNAFLNIDNRKMSKSLGNFFTVREILEKYDAQVLRFFMLSAHYRSPLNFSADLMEAAKNGLDRIRNAVSNLKYLMDCGTAAESKSGSAVQNAVDGKQDLTSLEAASGELDLVAQGMASGMTVEEEGLLASMKGYEEKFDEAMDDDFNTADAIAVIFEMVKFANSNLTSENSRALLQAAYDEIVSLSDILGLIVEEKEELLDADIEALIAERQAARKAKNFARADEIRNLLAKQGITLLDTREGVKWKRA